MLHCTAVFQFQHHTQLHSKCCTVLQYPRFSPTHSCIANVALNYIIPGSAPHTAALQMLHCIAVFQFQHHKQLHSTCCTVLQYFFFQPHTQLYYKCWTVLQYHSFSPAEIYTLNVALYSSIPVSASHRSILQMLYYTAVFQFQHHT
jgi:hypothetical protein